MSKKNIGATRHLCFCGPGLDEQKEPQRHGVRVWLRNSRYDETQQISAGSISVGKEFIKSEKVF